ncbi:heme/hemin ABC transporter substrate-binding protein [Granulosicoccus antarcticus]|uniref:Hemin-binding periplasmic protein HmuT n=1 Tax=Granulosicoccus antarcticus IMCC3135 TaxID=1192854 RepID=A0A2Z2P1Z8_9GAMM|nr:ABC transporter substrate-binding protein [Granulosicoccus antarcticus]ASJ76885.1 Hemin-binding periplasmic protein HmuT [Granulosicoccus antarcticus IMCC3135]
MTYKRVFHATRVVLTPCFFIFFGTLSISHAEQPQRIVSAAGSLTEIIYALNLEERLVGVDTTSQWPVEALEIAQVGYQRALSAEGILALAPDVVLLTADAGPPEVLQQLQDSGLRMESFPRDYSLEGVYARIEGVGNLLGKMDAANKLITTMKSDAAKLQASIAGRQSPGVAFLLGTDVGSSMAAGNDTSAHAMITLSGARNALGDYQGYKPVNAEALIEAAPEFLIVVNHGDDNDTADIVNATLALPGVALTPAGENLRIIVMDALQFLGFGPRTVEAMELLAHKLFEADFQQQNE